MIMDAHLITKTFGSKTALDKVSVHLEAGKVNVILGPNGAGKTTLISILLGLCQQDSGMVRLNGEPISLPYTRETRRRFLYLSDTPVVMDYLTGYENLCYLNNIYGDRRTPDELREILGEFGLDQARDRLVKGYSRGMKQRLCLSTVRLFDPEIMILDEPTIGLDIIGIRDLAATVTRLKKEGKIILIATHDLSFCRQVADEVILLKDGRICSQGLSGGLDSEAELEQQLLTTFCQAG